LQFAQPILTLILLHAEVQFVTFPVAYSNVT